MEYDGRLDHVTQITGFENVVIIDSYDQLDEYRTEIEEYQKDNEQYQIVVSYGTDSYNLYSLSGKIQVMSMIDALNSNTNVGSVNIEIDSGYDKYNGQILTAMMSKYTNVYHLYIVDSNS